MANTMVQNSSLYMTPFVSYIRLICTCNLLSLLSLYLLYVQIDFSATAIL